MLIPKRFSLAGAVWSVGRVPRLCLDLDGVSMECYGHCTPDEYSIKLLSPMSAPRNLQTYLHELTHAILNTMGHELYNDEQFVNTFSTLLHQAIVTAER